MALSEQLRESANTPEAVLSEVSAAMAVLASDGKLSLSLSAIQTFHILYSELARRQIMELYSGQFYKILLKLTESPYTEVQYNCAGVIGHLAINCKYRLITNSWSYCSLHCMPSSLSHMQLSITRLCLTPVRQPWSS